MDKSVKAKSPSSKAKMPPQATKAANRHTALKKSGGRTLPAVEKAKPVKRATRSRSEAVYSVAATVLRQQGSAIISRVAFGDEDVVVTRSGKPVAAIVPIQIYRLLRELEDAYDLAQARTAREEDDGQPSISLAALKARLGL